MYELADIRSIQLEPSSFCNARCPGCVRNERGFNVNTGYTERNLALTEVQQILPRDFVRQLHFVLYNGNLGDMLMNPEIVDITAWLLEVNPELKIEANTNGGAGRAELWQGLGRLGIQCNFALDGLEDTHHLYRQNTLWTTVIRNAKIFMEAGGRAVWKMIEFDHNRHQIDACRQRAQALGFAEFQLLEASTNRGSSIAFGPNGEFSHGIEGWSLVMDHREYSKDRLKKFPGMWSREILDNTKRRVECAAKKKGDLYINSLGEVYPCCFVGHNPRTIKAPIYPPAKQLRPLLEDAENNALQHPLSHCIQWFNRISETWRHDTIVEGGLIVCHRNCGRDEAWWDTRKRIDTL